MNRTDAASGPKAACVAACLVLAGAGTPARAATAGVEPRILAQEGLAIALASTVLQSQFDVLIYARDTPPTCEAQDNGGSVETTGVDVVSKTVVKTHVTVFYDTACAQPYVQAAATITTAKDSTAITETASYLGLRGQHLGALLLSESATKSGKSLVLIGLGIFKPTGGAPDVDLGLSCTITQGSKMLPCQGGVAQTFPALNMSLASVTPLTLTLKHKGSLNPVTFSGSSSTMQTGAAGSLSITEASPDTLGITGNGTAYGSVTTTGTAGDFTLFPPQPTRWTITDSAHDAKFTIQVVSNTTRALRGTVTTLSTGADLAKLAVDQSGSGTIAYADGTKAPIKAWLLGD